MPRRACQRSAGIVFHVFNRSVRRMTLFESPTDYYAFLSLMGQAQRHTSVSLLGYCVMPNHFHLVLRPEADDQLSKFMFRLCMNHSLRFHATHGSRGLGHVYQGRFKAIPVAVDHHFFRLCRYVERNPVEARLSARAEDWPWSSLSQRLGRRRPVRLDPWPLPVPENWLDTVNAVAEAETAEVRKAVRRGAPYGPADWREQMGTLLKLSGKLLPMGRPKKKKPGVLS